MNKLAVTSYPVHELIAQRWSPRAFDPRELGREQVANLLEAARWAASCFNEQPWRYVVALRSDQEAFAAILGCLMEKNRLWAQDAGALMISVAATSFTHNGAPNRFAGHDVGQANASMALQATVMGLAMHQMGGFDAGKAREVLGIPGDYEPMSAIAVGYPGDPASLPDGLREAELAQRKRKPLAELVFTGSFGKSMFTDE